MKTTRLEWRQTREKELRPLFLSHPGLVTDCHGVTFADGKYWINNDQVAKVLVGDGYSLVIGSNQPQPGDVIVYIDESGIAHSVTVIEVDPETGEVTKVRGLGGTEIDVHDDAPEDAWPRAIRLIFRRDARRKKTCNEKYGPPAAGTHYVEKDGLCASDVNREDKDDTDRKPETIEDTCEESKEP